MKRVTLENLLKNRTKEPYLQQYDTIMHLIETGKIKPVKASGTNGKKPALYREYWVLEEKKDYRAFEEELKFSFVPEISIDYYISHPDIYEQDREQVLMLNEYLKRGRSKLNDMESVNERSFEIWGREKFLSREHGKRILKRCGLDMNDLNTYITTEPLSYYSHTRETPQNLLIVENKDTFYSMRRHLLEGHGEILGVKIRTLIYGAGKGILRSFADFDLCVEPYMKAEGNKIYYFGDLDYEGIGIYESLVRTGGREILPFTEAYEAMLEKGSGIKKLPNTKEQQNRNIQNIFFSFFKKESIKRMEDILKAGQYIPQEILNISDF